MTLTGAIKIATWLGITLVMALSALAQPPAICRDSNIVQRYYASQPFQKSQNIPLQDGGNLTWGGEVDGYSSFNYISLFRLDASGQIVWTTQLFSNSNANFPQVNIIESLNGNLMISGLAKFGSDNRARYFFVACLDASANLLWYRFYETSIGLLQTEYPVYLGTAATDAAGNFYAALTYSEEPPGNYQASVVCKINTGGGMIWNKSFILDNTHGASRFLGVFAQNDTLSLLSSNGSLTPIVNMQLNAANASIINLKAFKPVGHRVWPEAESVYKINGNRYVLPGRHLTGNEIDFNTFIFDQQLDPVRSFHVKTFPVNYLNGWGGINKNMVPTPEGQLMYGIARNAESSFYYGLVDTSYRVTVQKRMQYTSSASGNFHLPPLRYYKDGKIFIHSTGCSPATGQCGLDYLSFDKDIQRLNSCFTAHDTTFMELLPFSLLSISFNWDQIEDNVLTPIPLNLTQQATVFTVEEVCKEINVCEMPVITGPDSICLSGAEVLYTVHQNAQCLKNVKWSVDGTSTLNWRQVNDTTIGVRFTDAWKGFITAGIDGSCNIKIDSQSVVVYKEIPAPALGSDTSLCEGDMIMLQAVGFTSYLWQDNSTASEFAVSRPGKYWVTGYDARGCIAADTISITDALPLSALLPADTTICAEEGLRLQPAGSFSSYVWSTGAISSSINISKPGKYWLTVATNDGCSGTDSISISAVTCKKRVYFPNAFSPDGNGVNDVFKPVVLGKPSFYELSIYNRWGQLIFKSTSPDEGWSGIWKGKVQRLMNFVWVCRYEFEKGIRVTEKGVATVL